MSGGRSQWTSSAGATNGSSRRKLTVDADDVAWQPNADEPEHGCLKLGDAITGEDNNNVELRPRQRLPYYMWLYAENRSVIIVVMFI